MSDRIPKLLLLARRRVDRARQVLLGAQNNVRLQERMVAHGAGPEAAALLDKFREALRRAEAELREAETVLAPIE